jgi:hypothetical protein
MDSVSATMNDVDEHWKKRIITDLGDIRQVHIEILKLAMSQQDATLQELANKLDAAIQNFIATVNQRLNNAAMDVPNPSWKGRVVGDLNEIRRIKVNLLLLAADREDTELAALTNRLHLIRCNLANTITLRFLANGVASVEPVKDCEETDPPPHDD